MLCTISGEPPQVPVASRKTGAVYEKRLIEAYISDHGTEPTTDEPLTLDDLLPLQGGPTGAPSEPANDKGAAPAARAPTQTSIPALLATFQSEWDALALEAFELRRALARSRQELSVALYDYEGALRVLARTARERDEARRALASVRADGPAAAVAAAADAEGMDVDAVDVGVPEEVVERVESTKKKLMATRRKRPVPKGWISPAEVEELAPTRPAWASTVKKFGPCSALARGTHEDSESLVYGSEDGTAVFHQSGTAGTPFQIDCGSRITDAVCWEDKAVFALASGQVKIYEGSREVAAFSVHAGAATGLALHPCGSLLASVGADRSYVLYDLENLKKNQPAARVFTDSELTCCQFHPDGHLIALGGADKEIKMLDVTTGAMAATFATADGAPCSLSFSENGTWLASASAGSGSVAVWDLRKAAVIKTLEFGGAGVRAVAWDWSAQYLAVVAGGALNVVMYSKSGKKWSELLKRAVVARRVAWDPSGRGLAVDGEDGVVEFVVEEEE